MVIGHFQPPTNWHVLQWQRWRHIAQRNNLYVTSFCKNGMVISHHIDLSCHHYMRQRRRCCRHPIKQSKPWPSAIDASSSQSSTPVSSAMCVDHDLITNTWSCSPLVADGKQRHSAEQNKDVIAARSMLIITITLWCTDVRPAEWTRAGSPKKKQPKRRRDDDGAGAGATKKKKASKKRSSNNKIAMLTTMININQSWRSSRMALFGGFFTYVCWLSNVSNFSKILFCKKKNYFIFVFRSNFYLWLTFGLRYNNV